MAVPLSARYNPSLREVNANAAAAYDAKDRFRLGAAIQAPAYGGDIGRRSASSVASSRSPSVSSRLSGAGGRPSGSMGMASPGADRAKRHIPFHCTEVVCEVVDMFYTREKQLTRDPNYMSSQTEVNEKMRTILIDWLVDVHLKFKLHEETFFLAVDLVDRYLTVARVSRSQLQLVGITCMLLAAKYEEIWPPEVSECIHVSANTYTRDEILKMERAIAAALSFKLTQPTPFPMLARLLEVTEADEMTRHAAFFFLEHAVLNYKHLQFLPSELAHASLYLANVMLRKPDPWSYTCQYYSRAKADDFKPCARAILDFAALITNSKYQAIRRKYSSTKYGEVSRMVFPTDLPM